MDEAGDPTPKYMLIRDAIKDYLPLPNISVPMRAPKMKLPPVQLTPKATLLSPIARQKLGHVSNETHIVPISFEKFNQYSGFVLYETVLPNYHNDPSILIAGAVKDRAHVFVDNVSCLHETELYCNDLFSHLLIFFTQSGGRWNVIKTKYSQNDRIERGIFWGNTPNFSRKSRPNQSKCDERFQRTF